MNKSDCSSLKTLLNESKSQSHNEYSKNVEHIEATTANIDSINSNQISTQHIIASEAHIAQLYYSYDPLTNQIYIRNIANGLVIQTSDQTNAMTIESGTVSIDNLVVNTNGSFGGNIDATDLSLLGE